MRWRLRIAASVLPALLASFASAQIDPGPGAHEWTVHDGPDFTISFPYSNFLLTAPLVQIDGVHLDATSIGPPNSPYSITHYRANSALQNQQRNTIVEELSVAGDGLERVSESDISLGETPGKETLVLRDGMWIRQRIYWTETDFYVLSVRTAERHDADPEADLFFASFRLH